MPYFNEHSLEMAIVELFEQQGYSYQNGDIIHKSPPGNNLYLNEYY
jgi:type I restriction enzyme R subunit